MIVWPEVFNLGIKDIDNQHKKIVDLINKVFYTMNRNESAENIHYVFDALNDYVRYHLRYEEEFMERIHYPHYDLHKMGHEKFEDDIFYFETGFKVDENIENVRDEIVKFLMGWLTEHIVDEDRGYARYYFEQYQNEAKIA